MLSQDRSEALARHREERRQERRAARDRVIMEFNADMQGLASEILYLRQVSPGDRWFRRGGGRGGGVGAGQGLVHIDGTGPVVAAARETGDPRWTIRNEREFSLRRAPLW
jgi:hypothetical protein